MRRLAFLLTIIAFISCTRNEDNGFGKHFIDKTLRINLVHTGNADSEAFKLDKIYDDGLWYGRTKNMVNPYRLGAYFYEVRDVATEELLYSDCISTVFSEWRMTEEAQQKKRAFNESIRIPYPIKNAKLTMYKIDSLDITEPVWEYVIDRRAKALVEPTQNHNNRLVRLLDSGDPKEKVDIVILGDGYTLDEIKKFDADALHFYNIFINAEPYRDRKTDFNVHAVQVPPVKSGNSLKISSGSLGHEKYALAYDEWAFREYATQAPYDYALILINDENNCGGSLFNVYTTTAIRSQSDDYIIRHELGHQIVGSADRFYSDDTANDSTDVSNYYHGFNELINKILDLHTK